MAVVAVVAEVMPVAMPAGAASAVALSDVVETARVEEAWVMEKEAAVEGTMVAWKVEATRVEAKGVLRGVKVAARVVVTPAARRVAGVTEGSSQRTMPLGT